VASSRDGEAYFYDVNALSNFVADARTVIGFNPYRDLAELIVARAGAVGASVSAA
jgi:predicted phage-related endonuclease